MDRNRKRESEVGLRRALLAGPGSGLIHRVICDVWDDLCADKRVVIIDCGQSFEACTRLLNSGDLPGKKVRSRYVMVSANSQVSLGCMDDLTVFDFYEVRHFPGVIRELSASIVGFILNSSVDKLVILEQWMFPTSEMLESLWTTRIGIDVHDFSIQGLRRSQLDCYSFDEVSQHLVAKMDQIEALVESRWVPKGSMHKVWDAYAKAHQQRGRVPTITASRVSVEEKTYQVTPLTNAVFELWQRESSSV